MITEQDFADAQADPDKRDALMQRAAEGEGLSPEMLEGAARERAEREADIAARAKADTLSNPEARARFFDLVRQGTGIVQSAETIGSSCYLVLCHMAKDRAFADELHAAKPARQPSREA